MNARIPLLILSSLSCLAAACGGNAPPPKIAAPPVAALPAPPATPSTTFRGTAALVARPEIQRFVDELAATGLMASKRVSYDGHPSAEYALYEQLRAAATDSEMVALVLHESPVVRSYAAQHVIERDLGLASVEPLIADATPVAAQYGCLRGAPPVSRATLQALCDFRERAPVAKKLAEIAKSGPDALADQARRCLALQ